MKNKKGSDLNISASAIETFSDCQRKWYLGYVERIRGPKSPAAERGDKIHDLAERYLKGEVDPEALEGEDNRYFRYLEPGLEYAPTPDQVATDGWGVEDWVSEPAGPLNFVGKVDFYNLDTPDGPVICDWKTTGNTQWRWSKTPRQLAGFLQPHVYAYALLKDNPPETVSFQHVNLQSKGQPDAMEVWAKGVPWSDVEETWQEVLDISNQMATVAKANKTAETVTPNKKACRKYGGCEHADICSASPKNQVTPNIPNYTPKSTTMNDKETRDRMTALRNSLGISAAPAEVTPTPRTPTPPKGSEAPPTAASLDTVLDNVRRVLDSQGRIPVNVLPFLASGQESEVIEALGLVKEDNAYTIPAAPEPPPEFDEWGTPAGKWLATGNPLPPNAAVMAGLIVPATFVAAGGTVTDAVARWGTDTQKLAARAIEELETPAPVEETPVPVEETPAPVEETPAPVEETPAPEPAPKTAVDFTTRKAARLILEALRDKDSVDRGEASDIIRNNTDWKRVSKVRWHAVAEVATAIAGRPVSYDEKSGSIDIARGLPLVPVEETPAPVEETPAPVEEATGSLRERLLAARKAPLSLASLPSAPSTSTACPCVRTTATSQSGCVRPRDWLPPSRAFRTTAWSPTHKAPRWWPPRCSTPSTTGTCLLRCMWIASTPVPRSSLPSCLPSRASALSRQ
jgi:hypothetical protein